jgi:hypothetical protein
MARTILERLLDIEREQEAPVNIPGTAGMMLGGIDATQEPIPYFSELDQQQRADAVETGLRMIPENIASLPGFAVDLAAAPFKYLAKTGLESAGYGDAAKGITYFPLTEQMQEGTRQGVNYLFGKPPELTDERQLPAILETAMIGDPLNYLQFAPAAKSATLEGIRRAKQPFQEGGAFNPKRVEGVVESPRIRLLEQMDEQAQLPPPQKRIEEKTILDDLLAEFDDLGADTKPMPKILQDVEEAAPPAKPVRYKTSVWDEFLPEAMNIDAAKPNSRGFVIEYPIDDFLRLAAKGDDPEKAAGVKKVNQFDSFPSLDLEIKEGGIAEVVSHEGRHRARELKARGHTTMPVAITSRGEMRWSKQNDRKNYDYRDNFPTTIRGQRGSESRENRDPLMPFPIQRGQYGVIKQSDQPQEGAMSASTFVSPDAVKLFAESGGSPAPSIGIARADAAHEVLGKFGDVQFIVSPERLQQGNYRIYGDDAYLGRAPGLAKIHDKDQVVAELMKDPRLARYKDEIPMFIEDFMKMDSMDGFYTNSGKEAKLGRAIKTIQKAAMNDEPLPHPSVAVGWRTNDYLESPGFMDMKAPYKFVDEITGELYDAESALQAMKDQNMQMRGSEFGASQKHTPFQNLFAREFKDLDEAKADRILLAGKGEKFTKSQRQIDEFNDLMGQISTEFLGGEKRTKTVGRDILEGRNIDEMMQKYNMKPEDIQTIKDKITNVQQKYKNERKNYFEAKGDEVIKLEDFDAVVIDEMYTDAIKILEDAGVKKILTYGTPQERANIFKKYPELLFSLMLVGLTGPALMKEQANGPTTNNSY